jgi:hypothetical protein
LAWLFSLEDNGGFAGLTKVSLHLKDKFQIGVGELLWTASLRALVESVERTLHNVG